MTRRHLAARVAALAGLTAKDVALVLDAIPRVLAEALSKEGQIHWRGLGTFALRSHPPRRIHNPATGKTMQLPARRTVSFKPGGPVRAALVPKPVVRRRVQ